MYPPTTDSSNQEPTPLNFVGQKKIMLNPLKKEKNKLGLSCAKVSQAKAKLTTSLRSGQHSCSCCYGLRFLHSSMNSCLPIYYYGWVGGWWVYDPELV